VYLYRKIGFYNAFPDIKEIDCKIGSLFAKTGPHIDDPSIIDIYKNEVSKFSSIEEMYKNINSNIILCRYVNFLTAKIDSSLNTASNTEAFSLLEQKINILESAYSNLVASSQQTSNLSV